MESYKCCLCEHEFNGPIGPTVCAKCQHIFVKWVSYNPDGDVKILHDQKANKPAITPPIV